MSAPGPRPSIDEALERQEVVWLSSIRPDGRPHLVSAWFLWHEGSIVVPTKPEAQKVRNLRSDPRVMLAIGEPDADFDIELVEGDAELSSGPMEGGLGDRFARKYVAQLTRAGTTWEQFATVYSQLIRIRPTRWLGWGGQGWAVSV
jgi:PPOX class probable F420-dependent enzyme